MNNNNNNNNNNGLVDNLVVDPSIARQHQSEYNDAQPAVDAQAPSIQPLPFEANNQNLSQPRGVQGGTILSSSTYNISDSGVHKVHDYSHNTSEQASLRMKQEEQRTRQTGKSIYQLPVTQIPSIAPNVDDGVKPSSEQIEDLRKQERYNYLQQKLRSLKVDEQRQETRLNTIRSAIKTIQAHLQEVEDEMKLN